MTGVVHPAVHLDVLRASTRFGEPQNASPDGLEMNVEAITSTW